MGVFGEAIYGHIGQYKARVYNACYIRSEDGRGRLVDTGGLTEQDTLNKIFGNITIGPQNDSSIVLSLNAVMKGYSWAVRMAPQAGSNVSGGYCHAVHCESSLSSLYMIDSFLYFPFIPDGEYCASLIKDPGSFTAQKRWQRNMQTVRPLQEEYNSNLGRPLNIPRDLLKRLTSYIVSQASVNARQYLYIRVPDQAPYEPYCLAALHDILSCIPAGLRAGISAATNCSPQEEQNYGIIFQRASFPVGHPTDISLHMNAEYSFLNNVFVSSRMRGLLEQIVDYPELTDKCYRTLEREVFGDKLPDSYQSYENYFGISTIQKDQRRPSYLEECGNLLGTTKEPVLRSILEKIILDEYSSPQDLEAAIQRDPLFTGVKTFTDLSGYLESRDNILAFLALHGIHYSKLFIYRHLNSIAFDAGAKNVIDLYDKLISEQRELQGFSENERNEILTDCRKEAWSYFAGVRSNIRDEHEMQAAGALYERLIALDAKVDQSYKPPVSERNWYNSCLRRSLLNQFRESGSPELADRILSVPDYEQNTENITCLTKESLDLIQFVIEKIKEMAERKSDPETAKSEIDKLIGLDDVIERFFEKWRALIPVQNRIREDYSRALEKTLYIKAVEYASRSDLNGNHLAAVISLASVRMPSLGIDCIHEIERSIADRLRKRELNCRRGMELYRAASTVVMDPELQRAYSERVASEIHQNTLEEENIRELYQTVQNPDPQLQRQFMEWSENTSRTKEYLEKMKASKTLIKYLNVLLQSGNKLSPQDISGIRSEMWNQLDLQERTISAFAASVAYLYNRSSEMVYYAKEISGESGILKAECRVLAENFGLGVYLDPDLSISELYENIRLYSLWTGMDKVVLYSRRDLQFSNQNVNKDSAGEDFYSIAVSTERIQDTLKRLLWVLDGEDYSYPGGEKVDLQNTFNDLMNHEKYSKIMKMLGASGILDSSPNLVRALEERGYQKESKRKYKRSRGGGIKNAGIGKYLPVAAALILTFLLGAIISHFAWPGTTTSSDVKRVPGTADSANTGSSEEGGSQGNTVETGGDAGDAGDSGVGKSIKDTEDTGGTENSVQEEKLEVAGKEISTVNAEEIGGQKKTESSEDTSSEGTDVKEESGEKKKVSKKISELRYNGDDDELKDASKVMEDVREDNSIPVEENQILLPGKASKVYTDESDHYYLVMIYNRWSYFENHKGEPQLKIEDPEKETWISVVKMKKDGDDWKYDTSKVRKWDFEGNIPEELENEKYPDNVIKKTKEFIENGIEYDEIKKGLEGCLKGKDNPIKKVIYDGVAHDDY